MADSVIIKGVRDGEPVDVLIDAQGRLQIVAVSASGNVSIVGPVTVIQAAAANLNAQVVGNTAHDDVDAGKPLKLGGKVTGGLPTPVQDADRVDQWYDEYGSPVTVIVGASSHSKLDIQAGRMPVTVQDPVTGNVQGNVGHDNLDSGTFPVKVGGKAVTSAPAAVGNGDRVDARFDELGVQGIRLYGRTTGGTEVPWTLNSIAGFGIPNVTVADVTTGQGCVVAALADNALNNVGILVRADNTEFDGTTWDRVRHSFRRSTTGIVAGGAGAALDMQTTPMSRFSLQVDRTAGSAAFTVTLEGTLDGTNWDTLGTHSGVDGAILSVVDRPMVQIRYNVTTIGASNTLSVFLLASGR